MLAAHRQSIVDEFEHGGRRRFPVAVEVGVGFEAVIEDDMSVVVGGPTARCGVRGEKKKRR